MHLTLLDPGGFVALLQVLMIDVVLAGDNAVVIGLAAARVARGSPTTITAASPCLSRPAQSPNQRNSTAPSPGTTSIIEPQGVCQTSSGSQRRKASKLFWVSVRVARNALRAPSPSLR